MTRTLGRYGLPTFAEWSAALRKVRHLAAKAKWMHRRGRATFGWVEVFGQPDTGLLPDWVWWEGQPELFQPDGKPLPVAPGARAEACKAITEWVAYCEERLSRLHCGDDDYLIDRMREADLVKLYLSRYCVTRARG